MPELLKVIREQGWSENAPGPDIYERTDVTCPYFPGAPVLDSSCNDNQRASFDSAENRRRDSQALSLGEGVYCFDYAFRILSVPVFRAGQWGWNLVGPEIHDELNQSPIQPQVLPASASGQQGTQTPMRDPALPAGTLRYFLDANAGRGPHRFFDLGPAPVGATDDAWAGLRMLVGYTNKASGFINVWREGQLIRSVADVTIAKAPAGWVKLANYSREAYVDGLQRYQIAGNIYRCQSAADVPPMPARAADPPDETPPPPPPPPPTDPCADVRMQLAAALGQRDSAQTERDAALSNLARVRAAVAAEGQRHAAAVAAALD